MAAVLTQAAESFGLEWTPPPCPKRSQLDDWFLGSEHINQPRFSPVPFILEVHDEIWWNRGRHFFLPEHSTPATPFSPPSVVVEVLLETPIQGMRVHLMVRAYAASGQAVTRCSLVVPTQRWCRSYARMLRKWTFLMPPSPRLVSLVPLPKILPRISQQLRSRWRPLGPEWGCWETSLSQHSHFPRLVSLVPLSKILPSNS